MMGNRGTSALKNVNDEIAALRQRLGSDHNPGPKPVQRQKPSTAGGGGVGTSTGTASGINNWMASMDAAVKSNGTSATTSTTAGAGGPSKPSALTSLLYAGTVDAKDLSAGVSHRAFPTTSVNPVNDDAMFDKHDVLRYLGRAKREFEEGVSVIDDFQYDEEAERRKAGRKAEPVHNDPFHFVEVSEVVANPKAEKAPAGNNSTLVATPPRNNNRSSRSSVAGSTAATSLTERHGFRNDLYSADTAIAKSRTAGNKGGLTQAALQAKNDQASSSTTSSSGAQPRQIVRTVMKEVKYRPEAKMTVVNDATVSFCENCGRLIIGDGDGECPHCGHRVAMSRQPLYDEEGVAVMEGGYGSDEPMLTHAANSGGSPGRAEMTPAEIEAEEARLFREAVAAWRSNDDGEGEDTSKGRNKTASSAAVGTGGGGERIVSVPLRAKIDPDRWARRTHYFSHLWGQLQKQTQ